MRRLPLHPLCWIRGHLWRGAAEQFCARRGCLARRLVPQPGFEQETWTVAEVDLLRRTANLAVRHGLVVNLACPVDTCRHDPLLRKVDVDRGVFVLACHHKLRLCPTKKGHGLSLRTHAPLSPAGATADD